MVIFVVHCSAYPTSNYLMMTNYIFLVLGTFFGKADYIEMLKIICGRTQRVYDTRSRHPT